VSAPRGAAALLAALLVVSPARADDEPWEPDPAVRQAPPLPEAPGFAPLGELAKGAIGYYQRAIGPQSIARCQFAVSCSRFAAGSIEHHGLLVGLLYFLDRFYFREHPDAVRDHPDEVVRTTDGLLKLDDGAFRVR
jgi:hypothetical protein